MGDPAVVLLHGLLFDGGMWRHQVEPLCALGRVVVFDGPGHGKSEDPPRFSLEDHVEALFDAFAELGIERAVIVGLSWGGMVAMRFALRHPKKVAALALCDTSADAERLANRIRYRMFAALHRRAGFPPALFRKEVAPLMFARRTLREQPELAERALVVANGFSREGLVRATLAVVVYRLSILDAIDRIVAPTLILCGREDHCTPPRHSEEIQARIRGSKLVWIDDAGHMSPLEQPHQIDAALVPFVKEHIEG